jgi:hypothetical protein
MVEDRVSRIAGGAVAKLDNGFIRILIYAPNILRITFPLTAPSGIKVPLL